MKQIYFIESGNMVKIGRTKDIEKRMSSIRTSCPFPIKLLAYVVADPDLEKRIHRDFAEDRVHGEWFNLSEKLCKFIEKLKINEAVDFNTEFDSSIWFSIAESDAKGKLIGSDEESSQTFRKEKKKEYESIKLTNHQKQIVLGTLLGKSYIVFPVFGRHCYLVMRQSVNEDTRIIKYKSEELHNLRKRSYLRISEPIVVDKEDIKWISFAHPVWNDFRDLFYKDGHKSISMDLLNQLNGVGLMTWFLDSGFATTLDGCRVIGLNLKDAKLPLQYFTEVGMDCSFIKINKKERLVFNRIGSSKFIATIGYCLPPFVLKDLKVDFLSDKHKNSKLYFHEI